MILPAAAVAGWVIQPLLAPFLRDALMDFLDEQSVTKVSDYLTRTSIPRTVAIAVMLLAWSSFVIAVDRVVDSALARRAG